MRNPVAIAAIVAAAVACYEPVGPSGASVLPDASPVFSHGEGEEASGRGRRDLRQIRASLIASAEALSDAIERRGVVAALGAAFTRDVQFLSPTVPIIQGASAAKAFLATNPVAPSAMRWDVVKADASSDGTHGFTWTRGHFTINLGQGAAERPGVFLLYWRRHDRGAWRVASMVFNVGSSTPQTISPGFGTPTTKHRRQFPRTSVARERAALMAADVAFSDMSLSHGTGPAFAAFAARDAMATSNGAFVFGPAAIGQAFTLGANDVVSWAPIFADVAAAGDLGFTVGDASFFLAEPNIRFYTKYLTVWQKQKKGDWKFVADLGSSRPAP